MNTSSVPATDLNVWYGNSNAVAEDALLSQDGNIITVEDLNVWYKNFHALKNINLSIERNSVTAFIGASGSGKSTCLRCFNRMIDYAPGTNVKGGIYINGEDILESSVDLIALRRNVGMVFQNPVPFPKSIYDNIAYGLEVHGLSNARRRSNWYGLRSKPIANLEKSLDPMDTIVAQSLKDAALWDEVHDRLHLSAYSLSGGQQQRLCIARSIAVKPDVLLLDEPCSDLDPISTRKIEETLMKLKEHYTIVIVTHNMQQAQRIADTTVFFHAGEIIEQGATEELFSSAKHQLTRDYVSGQFG